MHTHFGSATHLAATFLGVALVGSFWRLLALHAMKSRIRTVAGIGRAMLFQY